MARSQSTSRNGRIALPRETNTYRTSAVETLEEKTKTNHFCCSWNGGEEANTNHTSVVGTESKLTDRNFVRYAVRTFN